MSSKSESSVPKPLSAYIGLLLAAAEDTREPGASTVARIARFPIATFGQLLTARRRYDELADKGEFVIDTVVGMVRHHLSGDADGDDEGSDWIGDDFSSARGRATAALAVTTDVAGRVGGALGEVAGRAAGTVTSLTGRSSNGASAQAPVETAGPIDSPAAEPDPTPMEQLEQFSVPAEIGEQAGGLQSAADLPLDDFDHMSAPQLRGRLRSLDRVQLVQLLDYERVHANRVQIVLMLENRLTKLLAAGD